MYKVSLYGKTRKRFLVNNLIIKCPYRVQINKNDSRQRQNQNFSLKGYYIFNHENITHLTKHVSLGPQIIVLAYDPDPTIHGAYVSVLVVLVCDKASRSFGETV